MPRPVPSHPNSPRPIPSRPMIRSHPIRSQANRIAGNFMEQFPPFLLGLYGHTIFVDANRAAAVGWLWVAFRCYYPFGFGRDRSSPMIFVSTIPAYCCVWYLVIATVCTL